MDFLQNHLTEILLGVLALAATADMVVGLFARIPVIGPWLAPLARKILPGVQGWLTNRVGKKAEAIVAEVETKFTHAPQTGAIKKETAAKALVEAEPGLLLDEAEREIQAAFNRLVGQQALAQQAADRALTPKPAAAAGGAAVTP